MDGLCEAIVSDPELWRAEQDSNINNPTSYHTRLAPCVSWPMTSRASVAKSEMLFSLLFSFVFAISLISPMQSAS